MTIIPATTADIPSLIPLVNAAYRGQDKDSPKGWTSESHLIKGSRTNAAGITELLQTPHSVILKCIDEDDQLASCVHLEKQEDKLFLGMLSVWPERQGHGFQRTGEIQPFHHGEKFGIRKQPLELVVLQKHVI
jgi:hypothetical protein